MFRASSDLFSRLSSALAKKIDRNAQELTDREIRIFADHLVGSIKGLESHIEELEAEKSKLENDLAAAESKSIQLEASVEDINGRKGSLEKQLDDAKDECDRLNSRVQQSQASVDRLNADKANSQEDISELKKENAELFGAMTDLEGQVSVLRDQNGDLKFRIDQEKTRATVAEARLAAEVKKARQAKEALGHTEPEEIIDPPQIGAGRLTDAWRLLNDKQEPAYALVAAMCDLERNLRQVLDDPGPDLRTSLEMALQKGHISPEQRDGLERMRERRNWIVHGMVPFRLEESQVRNDLAYLEQVIDQL